MTTEFKFEDIERYRVRRVHVMPPEKSLISILLSRYKGDDKDSVHTIGSSCPRDASQVLKSVLILNYKIKNSLELSVKPNQ